MEKNKVSIIIPVYNAEKFIGETIESVISQTYTDWEMLILNDRSTDSSYEIIQKYAQKDKRIKAIDSEKNIGVVEGRNRLIDEADGEYIAFLDSDDYWKEDKLEKQIEFMKKKNILVNFIEKIEKRAMSRSQSIANKEFLGLMIFVAIPFPGTGAWTGALIAALLQFDRKKSFVYIFIGVLIAASLVTLGVYGVRGFL